MSEENVHPRCRSCFWWDTAKFWTPGRGWCKKGHPVCTDGSAGMAIWPITNKNDWCGDQKPAEKRQDESGKETK